jgi:hypothetical protein
MVEARWSGVQEGESPVFVYGHFLVSNDRFRRGSQAEVHPQAAMGYLDTQFAETRVVLFDSAVPTWQ